MNISEVIIPPQAIYFLLSFVLIQKKQKIKAVKRELKSIRIAKIF